MKKISGSVVLMLVFLVLAIAGAAALAIGGINVVQRAVGAHTEEARQLTAQETPASSQQPGALTSPATGSATMSAAQRQEWADAKIDRWLAVYGDESISDLVAPYQHVEAWYCPAEGELALLTSSQHISDSSELAAIAGEVMKQLRDTDPGLQTVSVSTSNGTLQHSVQR